MAEEETKPAHGDSSRIQVDVVRMFLSCGICGELLKDARSITECLHTCKGIMFCLFLWFSVLNGDFFCFSLSGLSFESF